MRILVLGSGAREHALAWKLSRSPGVRGVYAGPGNAGTPAVATTLAGIDPSDFGTVRDAVLRNRIDCVFVGPEAPLASGIVDFLHGCGIPAIGPFREAARLEASKAFSKAFLLRNGIPTAMAREVRDTASLDAALTDGGGRRLVLKKSGLAAGKGVLESSNPEEMKSFGRAVLASDTLLVEEFLEGWEVSVFGVSDGKDFVVLPPCTDFKKAHDGDTGPNTGGMGSVCPVPWADDFLMDRILREVVTPTYAAMAREGLMYKGVLYFGIMVTPRGPSVLEFNVRFGDPETQVLLPMVDTDFGELLESVAAGTLEARFGDRRAALSRAAVGGERKAALGVVIAGRGYPESSPRAVPVDSLPETMPPESLLFHAGTARDAAGRVITGGGRCFTAVGVGSGLAEAGERAYAAAGLVRFDGGWHRSDIGKKFMGGAR